MTKDMLARAVRKFKKGDMRAFDYIYDCTHKVVYFVAYSVLRSKADKRRTMEIPACTFGSRGRVDP